MTTAMTYEQARKILEESQMFDRTVIEDLEPGDQLRVLAERESEARATLLSHHASQCEEAERLREALTPSAETKAAYSGEFKYDLPLEFDEEGYELPRRQSFVSWDTIKEIMEAIKARAALENTDG